jgi:hypothetical protein
MYGKSKFISLGYALILVILLFLPVVLVALLVGNLSASRIILIAVDSLVWLICSWGLLRFLPRTVALLLLLPLLTGIIFLRFVYLGLINFSGAGFTSEFFIHFEWQSIVIAWQEYLFITLGGFLACLLLVAGFYAGRKVTEPSPISALVLLFVGCILISVRYFDTPEGEFARALWRWNQPASIDLPSEQLAAWQTFPLVNTELVSKRELQAFATENPLNIILVYLESVGQPLIDHPRWPDLMPGLKRLNEEHSFIDNFFASAYVTIEGLVNSQCGTLFPFDRGEDALASSDGLAEEMICVADVLAGAGYHSSYLGGANTAYAGKGDFLRAHGFHNVKGGEYWANLGLYQRPDTWGVSDADLFEQARKELALLRNDGRPFNLTLLTIGTHLPGYNYEECLPYQDGKERFLNALHCTDQLLMNWLGQIEADGHLDDSVVIITADHHIFPNPEMRRLFGDETLERRKVPFIVLDPKSRKSEVSNGAAYDLAPTILDLAGVQHNNRFALGRSLFQPEAERNYFFRRYEDVLFSVADNYSHGVCETDVWMDETMGVPLTPCQRQSMKTLLSSQIRNLSKQPAKLECDKPALTHVHLPPVIEAPIEFFISGKNQSDRFVMVPRRVAPDSLGLYLARVEHNTEILDRTFIPEESLKAMDEPPGITDKDLGWFLIWHGTSTENLPSWLDLSKAQARMPNAALWLIRIDGERLEWLPRESEIPSQPYWVMNKETCNSLLALDAQKIAKQ